MLIDSEAYIETERHKLSDIAIKGSKARGAMQLLPRRIATHGPSRQHRQTGVKREAHRSAEQARKPGIRSILA